MSYVNPILFSEGLDNLKGKYLGWLLVGAVAGTTDVLNSTMLPASDSCIAGVMTPVAATLGSTDENGTLTYGNIGSFVSSDSVQSSESGIFPVSDATSYTSETNDSYVSCEDITRYVISDSSSLSSGTTKIFVRLGSGGTSVIFPHNVTADNSSSNYIDISSGKVILVEYKDGVIDSTDNFMSVSTENSPLYNLAASESGSTTWVSQYISKVLFAYDVSASNGNQCNDYTYTGFSVGNIEATISGLSS